MRGMTKNQTELLTHVKAGGEDGPLDFDQLLDLLSWQPSKESAQFTVRALVTKGLLEKLAELPLRRSRKRICYQLTEEGLRSLDPRPAMPKAELGELELKADKPFDAGSLLSAEVVELEVSAGLLEGEEVFVPGLVSVEIG